MKRKITLFSMTLIVGGLLYFTGLNSGTAHDTGAPASTTNSPHDGQSCDKSSCHNTHPLQNAQPWITSNVPVYGYTQDSIYTITARAIDAGFTSFGFEISPQSTGGSQLGSLIITNATTTKIVAGGGLQYVTHTINGYKGTDSLSWTFNWKAPAKGTGPVTFYGCFNIGNGNSTAANTFVFPATLTVQENATDGIADISNAAMAFSVFPNPAKEQVNIAYSLKKTADMEVNMYDINGRKITTLSNSIVSEGNHTQNVILPTYITRGIYIIQLIANGQSTIQRIIIE
ncbi:MAG TPA: choice-of-anchor V domain-containing protein [Bacteroidia bacterium]|nr:choice-of-anchor V domain-containing protein [Bacteroidia bacterium]